MKILITGIDGQLGTELQQALESGETRIGAVPEAYVDAEIIGLSAEDLDISQTEEVLAFVSGVMPDLIINADEISSLEECARDPEAAMKRNAIGARNLAYAARLCGSRILMLSTDNVFSGLDHSPRSEWDVCDPRTVYGKSKLLGEQYTAAQCSRYYIFRTGLLYGTYKPNYVTLTRRAGRARAGRSIKAYADTCFNLTSASDVVYHILRAALTEEYGIYHCVAEGEYSYAECGRRIMDLSGLDCEVEPVTSLEYQEEKEPGARPAMRYSTLTNRMLECTIGNRMRRWDEALADYIDLLDQ